MMSGRCAPSPAKGGGFLPHPDPPQRGGRKRLDSGDLRSPHPLTKGFALRNPKIEYGHCAPTPAKGGGFLPHPDPPQRGGRKRLDSGDLRSPDPLTKGFALRIPNIECGCCAPTPALRAPPLRIPRGHSQFRGFKGGFAPLSGVWGPKVPKSNWFRWGRGGQKNKIDPHIKKYHYTPSPLGEGRGGVKNPPLYVRILIPNITQLLNCILKVDTLYL